MRACVCVCVCVCGAFLKGKKSLKGSALLLSWHTLCIGWATGQTEKNTRCVNRKKINVSVYPQKYEGAQLFTTLIIIRNVS